MAYCENIHCRKTGLRKEDVELDRELGAILCQGCYALRHPGWKPPGNGMEVVVMPPATDGFGYSITIDSYRGASARLNFGAINLELMIPPKTAQKLLGNV